MQTTKNRFGLEILEKFSTISLKLFARPSASFWNKRLRTIKIMPDKLEWIGYRQHLVL